MAVAGPVPGSCSIGQRIQDCSSQAGQITRNHYRYLLWIRIRSASTMTLIYVKLSGWPMLFTFIA